MASNKLNAEQRDDLAKLEKIVDAGIKSFVDVGNALMQIRDRQLYRETCSTFESYVQVRFGWSRAHAYRHIEAAKVVALIAASPIGDIEPASESLAREMVGLPAETVPEVWHEVVEETGGQPTAKDVAKAAAPHKPKRERTPAQKARARDRRSEETPESGDSSTGQQSKEKVPEVGDIPTGVRSESNTASDTHTNEAREDLKSPADESGVSLASLSDPAIGGGVVGSAELADKETWTGPLPAVRTSVEVVRSVLAVTRGRVVSASDKTLVELTDAEANELLTLSLWAKNAHARRKSLLESKSEAA